MDEERNHYNFTTFDRKYTPLLESHDAGELENKGGLVVAEIGRENIFIVLVLFYANFPPQFW